MQPTLIKEILPKVRSIDTNNWNKVVEKPKTPKITKIVNKNFGLTDEEKEMYGNRFIDNFLKQELLGRYSHYYRFDNIF